MSVEREDLSPHLPPTLETPQVDPITIARETTEALVRRIMEENGFTVGATIAPENITSLTGALALEIDKRDVVIGETLRFFDETSKRLKQVDDMTISRGQRLHFLIETLRAVMATTKQSLSTLKFEREVAGPVKNEQEREDGGEDVKMEDTPIKVEEESEDRHLKEDTKSIEVEESE